MAVEFELGHGPGGKLKFSSDFRLKIIGHEPLGYEFGTGKPFPDFFWGMGIIELMLNCSFHLCNFLVT
jgi:hypothetical protein